MFTSIKRLIISTIFIVLIVSALVVFVPSWKIERTIDQTIEQLNATYEDDFTITWSDLEKQPLATSFVATALSEKTGIVYDVTVNEAIASIAYEAENDHMALNRGVENAFDHVFALSTVNDQEWILRILSTEEIKEEPLKSYIESIKLEQSLQDVQVEWIQMKPTDFETATAHIKAFYQRSTVPVSALNIYEQTVTTRTY